MGKTFKGLTDEEFRWMTKRLQAIKVSETDYTVSVRPEVVVEVAFNEVQRSPHYKSGFALRFARITRIRDDKGPRDAETLDQIRHTTRGSSGQGPALGSAPSHVEMEPS